MVGSAKVLAAKLDGADAKTLREAMDKLKDKLKSAAIVLGAVEGDKVTLIAGVTADLTAKVKAGELVNFVAQQVGGKGGGRPDMAQAGGTDPTKIVRGAGQCQRLGEAKNRKLNPTRFSQVFPGFTWRKRRIDGGGVMNNCSWMAGL